MKYPVRLFLGNEEVEFSQPPQILFNYSETELTNPTIVKNSYSKTVTIEGTPKNNRIFGHIYDMQRIQGYDGTMMGSSFNPLVKTDFTLYYNSSIYESGYFKLDEVRRNDNNIEYDITLYGGLGDYFYNLSFREDGNSMELSDLKYEVEDWAGELGFQINKEAVKDAWLHIWQPSSKWDTINFAPCYNGLPSSLSADKYLINTSGMTVGPFADRANTGYIIGTSKEEHTEWESFDLRSYLQRPVIRVKEVLKAIANPVNNGGYTVNLDSDFFTPENPYYWDSWMTLPLLTELDVPATLESALTVTAITLESRNLYHLWDGGATATNVQVDVDVKFTPSDGYTGDSIYLSRQYDAKGGATLQSRFAKYYIKDCTVMIQMIGYNESGQMSTFSNLYELITPRKENILHQPTPKWYSERFVNAKPDGTSVSNITPVYGKFTKKNGEYVFTDMSGNTQTLRFTFPSNSEFTKLKLKIVPFYKMYREYTWGHVDSVSQEALIDTWSQIYRHSNSWQDMTLVQTLDRVVGTVSYEPVGATGTTTSFEGFYSNRTFTKKDLLTVGITPAQFLLSYAKMFGLYFIKDVESKTIDILTRHNFYLRDEVVNINDLVDKGSDIKITPNSPQYQYYDFGLEQVESEAADSYRKTYGNDYGTQVVNTGYQYEKEHKHLLDGNAFKGGINVMEKNKYFIKPTQGIPCLVFNGFSYTYEDSTGGTTEVQVTPQPMAGIPLNPDHKYYDFIAKPQFHTANNEASDGAFVLLFFSGNDYSEDGHGLKLTDDLEHMYTLNDGQPCWLITMSDKDASGNTIALTVDRYPIFTRDIYNFTGYISNSFDLGTPLTTYVPDKFVSDWQNIYSRGWKSYISDLYDVNTRILRCRCLLRERPNPDWMRRFYWFDNSYWRLNQIKDWDISSFDTTEMEFIKVQDISDYDNVLFSYCPVVEGSVEMNPIDYSAHTLTGRIYVSDGSSVSIGDVIGVAYSDGTHDYWSSEDIVSPLSAYGTTNVQITINIPANTSGLTRTISIPIEDGCDKWHYITITQGVEDHIATISPTSLSFDYTGGTKYLSISDQSNHGWSLSENSDWITLSQYSGTGSTTVAVTTTVNSGQDRRNAEVTFRDSTITGTTTVYVSQSVSMAYNYLTAEFLGNGWFTFYKNSGEGFPIYYSKNNGTTWENVFDSPSVYGIEVSSGETVIFKSGYPLEGGFYAKGISFQSTVDYNLYGNIASLGYEDNFRSITSNSAIYSYMFTPSVQYTGSCVNASSLFLPEASGNNNSGSYSYLFAGDKRLVSVPPVLSSDGSYSFMGMFSGCTSLVNVNMVISIEGARAGECNLMFVNCTSLTSANISFNLGELDRMPDCGGMFRGCTSLVTPPSMAGSRPNNFESMFEGCTSLTTAPDLPYTNISGATYSKMFSGCTSLNYIKCLAESGVTRDRMLYWVENVASSGTFVRSANKTDWAVGGYDASGIPENWVVVVDGDFPATIYPTGQQNFDATGGTKTLTVTDSSNHGWTVNNTGTSWISISPSAGTGSQIVTVTAQANGTANSRSSIIVFQDNNSTGSTTIPVSQAAGVDTPATITPLSLTYDNLSNTKTLTVSDPSNHGWTVSGNRDWFSLSPTSGNGDGIVTVIAQPNTTANNRSGNIGFLDSTETASTYVSVSQPKWTGRATCEQSQTGFTEYGGVATLTVTDGYQRGWYIYNIPNWISFEQTQGTGSTAFTFTVAENQSVSARTAICSFSSPSVSKSIGISQSGSTSPTPTAFAHINFTYGDVDAPETGNWDYVIYYSFSGAHPAGEGTAMANIGGVLLYPGSPWNPSQASNWEIYQPFSGDTYDTSGIDLPQSFAGQTIYIQAELGNPELGYAVESQTVSVTIPSGGGEVNVTIPQI